ncbi:MAG: hypothetical protein NTX85_00190 [Candidatus Nomurabacteria bacterium]|nr:hypothetical protein [Candidatus Nomurabacteria bacterium]
MLYRFSTEKQKFIFHISLFIFCTLFISPVSVLASNSNGTFDPTNLGYNRAYLITNSGLNNISKEINVGKFTVQPEQNANIFDFEINGWMWGSATGWISYNCSNVPGSCISSDYKVTVDQYGNLSGYAWGPQTGWVNFAPTGAGDQTVKINSDGTFAGYAWAQSFGYISFNCSNDNSCGAINFKTMTDYIPYSVRPRGNSGGHPIITPEINPDPNKNKTALIDKIPTNKNTKNTNSKKTSIKISDGPILSSFIPPEQPPKITKPKNTTEKNEIPQDVNFSKKSWFRIIVNYIKSTPLSFYQFIKNLMQ